MFRKYMARLSLVISLDKSTFRERKYAASTSRRSHEPTRTPPVPSYDAKMFDYPAGDENIFARDEGTGGVRVGSWLRGLVLAAYVRLLQVLLGSVIASDSRVI